MARKLSELPNIAMLTWLKRPQFTPILPFSLNYYREVFGPYWFALHNFFIISAGVAYRLQCKGLDTCYSATYMSQARDQQRFTISEVAAERMSQRCRSALCGHPLPALTDNWTHDAASSHTRPSPRSRNYYSFPSR